MLPYIAYMDPMGSENIYHGIHPRDNCLVDLDCVVTTYSLPPNRKTDSGSEPWPASHVVNGTTPEPENLGPHDI
jgi:hypothetical protein